MSLKVSGLVLAAACLACSAPDPQIFEPPEGAPVEVEPGVFRLTFNPGPDVARGFSPDGERVLYRSRGLAGFGEEWRILSLPVDGGAAREEAAIYRAALVDTVGALAWGEQERLLSFWKTPNPPLLGGCGAQCLRFALTDVVMLTLELNDGVPLSQLPARAFRVAGVEPPEADRHRLVFNPAQSEARRNGTNPYGPVILGATGRGAYSDGADLWLFETDDAQVPPQAVGPGIWPSASRDGRFLAAAVPLAPIDTVSSECIVPLGLAVCVQETLEIRVSNWVVVMYDLEGVGKADYTRDTVAMGASPVLHPDGNVVLVIRDSGIFAVDIAGGSSALLPGTEGALGVFVSPDGETVAITSERFGQPDLFLTSLSLP